MGIYETICYLTGFEYSIFSEIEWWCLLLAAGLAVCLSFKIVCRLTYKPLEELSKTELWKFRLAVFAFFTFLLLTFVPEFGLEGWKEAREEATEKSRLEAEAKILAEYIKTGEIEDSAAWWTWTTRMKETGICEFEKIVVGRTPEEAREYISYHSKVFLPVICAAEGKTLSSVKEWWEESGKLIIPGKFIPGKIVPSRITH